MSLRDIMAVGMNGKYMSDSSSSSSDSSDSESENLSSSSSASSSSSSLASKKSATTRHPAIRSMAVDMSDGDGDSDLDANFANKKRKKKMAVTKKVSPKKTAKSKAPPPPSPPPPAPSASDDSSDSSSSIASSDSSGSDSSGSDDFMSDTDTKSKLATLQQAVRATAAKVNAARNRNSSDKSTAATKIGPESLKVTLKLPPGFIAKSSDLSGGHKPSPTERSKVKVKVTNSRPAPKRQRDSSTAPRKQPAAAKSKSKQATPRGTKKAKHPTPASNGPNAVGSLPSSDHVVPTAPTILSKLIPTGLTIPREEIRGAKELLLKDITNITRPEETHEKDIPTIFNDQFAHETEALRNLDLFFFCDENGNSISLEVLDRPKDQRPRIMGFGTVVQHLPPDERPVPGKRILPSPAFPSRSKKRPRTDSTALGQSKNPIKTTKRQGVAKKRDRKKTKVSDKFAQDDYLFQADGEFGGYGQDNHKQPSHSIFQRDVLYNYSRVSGQKKLSQIDGQSTSGSDDSDFTSDDEDQHSHRSGSVGRSDGADNAMLSSTSSSSSSDDEHASSNSASSSAESDIESGAENGTKSRGSVLESLPSKQMKLQTVATDSQLTAPPSRSRTKRSPTKAGTTMSGNPDVSQLMRTDIDAYAEPEGTDDQLNLMECGFRHPSDYNRMRVWLPEITDWCLDYSEGDPTLWVITPHAWYKIAGPLSGMLPHPSYREKFQHVRKLFEASYLVAYVLKEWLPINKKVSYRATLQQIVELSLSSRYRVSAWFLVENYQFIRSQICNLFPDKDTYVESMFFKQLQRLNENHKSREERMKKEHAERELRRLQRENERMQKKQKLEDERQKWKDQREEERKQKEQERKFPIEDLELLEGDDVSQNLLPVPLSDLCGVGGQLLGEIIMAWRTICTFKDFVSLEPISLETLVQYVTTHCDEGNNVGLVQIFLSFLRAILAEKSFTSLLDDLVVEGNIKVSDLFVNTERTYGICERPYTDMLNAITWQDILRQLMSKDLGIDPSIGHVEPLVGCEIVRQTLYMQANSAPFNAPVDITLKGLEDYAEIIKSPMDLGTIKQKIDSGAYEGFDGYEEFAADVRLVWENAVLYNGEDSEVGRTALALSDIFEQDFQRFVVGRIEANKLRIEGCKKVQGTLADKSVEHSTSVDYVETVYGLYSFEFHQLPMSWKVGALSWLCSEFLKLSSVRNYLEVQVQKEFSVWQQYRKSAAELESRRKHADKARREKELAFRKSCADQGILPNSHNVFSDATKKKYEFIGKFYEDLQLEKSNEDAALEQERKTQMDELTSKLESIVIRELPLGKDRYHNLYWTFSYDTRQRLFIEKSDSGEFIICDNNEHLLTLLSWLNPKGIREAELLSKLTQLKEQLINAFSTADTSLSDLPYIGKGTVEVNMFPLPGDALKPEVMIIREGEKLIKNHQIVQEMLRCLLKHFTCAGTLPSSWDESKSWETRLRDSKTFGELRDLFAEVEDVAVTSSGGLETIRQSWKRKRREWRLGLEGACTYAQLVFLLYLFLDECINVEAFMDRYIRLDRKEWLKLRPKESRNFIPDVGKTVVYFGDGHAQAIKEDAKTKKKRFTQKSGIPIRNVTAICVVDNVTFHHGGGDPYALATLRPVDNMLTHACVRKPGTILCPQPSPLQRLSRILLRIVSKLKSHADAGPFLEPVSDREFPEYKEIILHPMDLVKVTTKVKALAYQDASQFVTDIKLICSNCVLFCEDRFPMLPPLARNLVEMAQGLVKRSAKEIRACESGIKGEPDTIRTPSPERKVETLKDENQTGVIMDAHDRDAATQSDLSMGPIITILRLENRLPEYIVDVKRYETAINRSWYPGESFRMLFRDPHGFPGEYYGGVTAGSLPFDQHGMLPWEALRVTWNEDDGSDDSRINPWEAEMIPVSKKFK